MQATRSFVDIATNAALDIHPPGYYWLLAVWRGLTGDTEFALRLLSALASTLTVAAVFALGKRLYGTFAGAAAAMIVALNTFSIYYAQEARMYALLGLWSALGMWAFAGFFTNRQDIQLTAKTPSAPREGKKIEKWAIALALVNAAGLWTHYAYPFVMLAQGVMALAWFVVEFRRLVKTGEHTGSLLRMFGVYVAANVATIVLFAPWLPTALDRLLTWPNTGEIIPADQALNTIFGWLSFGVTYEASGATFGIVLFLLLFGLLTTQNTNLTAKTPSAPRKIGDDRWNMLLPVVWVVVPVAIFMARGLFREANLKLLLPAQMALALWIGRGVWMLWQGQITRVRVGAKYVAPLQVRMGIMKLAGGLALLWLSVNLFAGLNPLYHDAAFQRDNYRAIVAAITADARAGDAIILDAPNQQEVFDYYYHGAADVYPLPQGLGGDDDATYAAVTDIIAQHDRVFAVLWGEAERDPQRIVEATLSAQTFKAGDEWYGDVRLVRYVMPADAYPIVVDEPIQFGEHITLAGFALNADTFAAGDVLQVQLRWTTDAPLDTRYNVTVQLLNEDGVLVTQHDGEPGGGLALTTGWAVGETISDNHALVLPNDLTQAHYTLIIGLYDVNNPTARVPAADSDSATLYSITIHSGG
ncbi:MAG: glycosyltransferase family 39 protein [Anaerolineae bacterium]